jgi:uncharacterized protein YcgI (DUF1989 family)
MSVSSAHVSEIPPQSGTAFRLRAGEILRVIDPRGEQVADLTAFAADDEHDALSSGRTIDYAQTMYLTAGHILYSARSRPMFMILRDDVGRHDFLLTPCSRETFAIIYKHMGPHPSCLDNLAGALAAFDIPRHAIPTTFNIFMNVEISVDGGIVVCPPRSKGGDCIELRAEMDLIVGLTACSAEMSNNGTFKPIHYSITGKPAARLGMRQSRRANYGSIR